MFYVRRDCQGGQPLFMVVFFAVRKRKNSYLMGKEVTNMKNFNKKKLILPILLMIIAFVSVPFLSSEIDSYGTFFITAVGLGCGIMANQFVFKKA